MAKLQKLNVVKFGHVSPASLCLHVFGKWLGLLVPSCLNFFCAWCVLVARATGKPKKPRFNDLLRRATSSWTSNSTEIVSGTVGQVSHVVLKKLAVFMVCKHPSDCILHAEAPCPSRLSANHVCKTCQEPSVRKLRWSDCQQLSAHRKASQHSECEQPALSHVGSKHFTHPQRLPGSIFEQAGLNDCFRLPTYRDARRHHKAQHMEYPGIPRQASDFCIVQKNWQFSLSAEILQIASCTQKHLAHPDCQRIMCARLARDHQSISEKTTLVWLSAAVSTSQSIATFGMRTAGTLTCGLQARYTSTKAARKHLWASWIECLFSTANLSRRTEASQSSAYGVPWYPKTSLWLLHSPEKLSVFIVCKNPSDCILHAEATFPSRLSANHVCKTCQEPSVRKLRWSDCQQLSAHRKASQHSECEQPALSHVGSKHFTHPQRLPGSIFEQAGLNVCFRLPTYRDARRHHKAQHMEYPGIPRQASDFCIVQKNWQFSLSAEILQIASCTQKQLAHPDCQRIMCARLARNHQWENYCQHVAKHRNIRHANSRHLIHAQRLPRIMFGKAWIACWFNSQLVAWHHRVQHGGRPLKTNLRLLHSSEQLALFISSVKSSGSHPARTSTLPLTLSYHVCRSCSEQSVRKLCGVFGGTVSKASQHSAWEQPALHFTPWNTSCSVFTLCQLICLDCIMQSRKLFGNFKAALPILARQNTSSWWWTTPWATYLTQLIQFCNWNPDKWQNKYSHHNRKSLGKSSTNATLCCNTNATELASLEGLIECLFSTANLSRRTEASQSSAHRVPWYPKTSLWLLHSPEILVVFFVCKKPSDIFRLHPARRSALPIPTLSVSCVQDLPGTISEKTTLVWLSAAVSTSRRMFVFDCQLIVGHGGTTKLSIWSTLVSQDKPLTPA